MSFCFRECRIDTKNPAHEFFTVKGAYRSERLLLIGYLDKPEPPGFIPLLVHHNPDRSNATKTFK
jgi:hypothetical protein